MKERLELDYIKKKKIFKYYNDKFQKRLTITKKL